MRITLGKVVVVVIILAMVWGWKWLDDNGYLGNPIDRIPSVEFGR